VGSSGGPFDNGRPGEIAPATTVSITPNSGPQSPSGSDGADQSADAPPEDFQDAAYTPVQPTTVLSSNGQPMGMQIGAQSGGPSLEGVKFSDLKQMNQNDILSRLPNTTWSNLDDASQRWLVQQGYGQNAVDSFGAKANADSVQAELAEGYALSGLSQAVIRDVGPPTAVQVRISAPDKL
jgi:hypothetical protein